MPWLLGILLIGVGLWAARRKQTGDQSIRGVVHVNINCTDFDRSKAFYQDLGFRQLFPVVQDAGPEVAMAVGMTRFRVRGAMMVHKDGTVIDLLQWEEPATAPRERMPLHEAGLARMAFLTPDLDAEVARLRRQGVRFLSEDAAEVPDGVGGKTRFICFEDPDGTVLELIEMGAIMGAIQGASMSSRANKRAKNGSQ